MVLYFLTKRKVYISAKIYKKSIEKLVLLERFMLKLTSTSLILTWESLVFISGQMILYYTFLVHTISWTVMGVFINYFFISWN